MINAVEDFDLTFIDRQLVKQALEIAERRDAWLMSKDVLVPVVNAMRKLGADVGMYDNLHITLIGDAKKLADGVRVLRTSGYSSSSTRPVKGDTTWSAFFYRSGSLAIYFNFSSSVCRRVQTGTKMVETPVFDTVCDSIELPDSVETVPPSVELKTAEEFEMPF